MAHMKISDMRDTFNESRGNERRHEATDILAPRGTPDPSKIGKTQSHGCVRLTNWDALDLARRVRKGVQVAFLDAGQKTDAGGRMSDRR